MPSSYVAGGSEFVLQMKAMLSGNAVDGLSKARQAADSAIGAFSDLETKLRGAEKALEKNGQAAAALQAKLAKATEMKDAKGVAKLTADLQKVKGAEAELRSQIDKTNAELAQQATAASRAATEFAQLDAEAKKVGVDGVKTADGLSKLPGPLGGAATASKDLQESWGDLSANLGKGGAALAIGAVAVIAFAAAIVAATVKVAAWAVGLANARRNLSLTLEAMEGGAEGGAKLGQTFSDVSKATGVGSDRLLELTRELKKAKVSAEDMPSALKAIATQEAALGSQDGTADLIKGLEEGKLKAGDLAKEMESKFGGVVAKRMLSLESQSETFGRNISALFGSLDIEPLLKGMSTLVALFDPATASGKAMQSLFGSMFQPLISGAGGAAVSIEAMVLKGLIAVRKLQIGAKKLSDVLKIDTSGFDAFIDSGAIGTAVMSVLYGAAFVVATAIAAIVAGVYVLIGVWNGMAGIAAAAWGAVTSGIEAASSFISGVAAKVSSIGKDMITGLVNGIKAGATAVSDAIGGVVDGAIAAAKEKLQIASPSKVFMRLGEFTSEGMSEGIDDGAEDVQQSMREVVEPPSEADVRSGTAKGSSSSSGSSITIQSLTINGVPGADSPDFEAKLARAIQRALEQLGGGGLVTVDA